MVITPRQQIDKSLIHRGVRCPPLGKGARIRVWQLQLH